MSRRWGSGFRFRRSAAAPAIAPGQAGGEPAPGSARAVHADRCAERAAIQDPAGRLPPGAHEVLGKLGPGTLFVPDRGVPIHPASLAHLAALAGPRPLSFVPEIPIASQLGLARYQPILYWLPDPRPRHPWRFSAFWDWLSGRAGPGEQTATLDLHNCLRVPLRSEAEQIHYFADHFPAVAPAPIQVSVVLSNLCNLHCAMCPYHSRAIRATHTTRFFAERRVMGWEVLDRIAAECGQHHVPVKMGNVEEPLLHPRIVDFVRACRARGAPAVHITTNGTLLTDKMARSLLDAGLTSLYVSLDAARPETYRAIRGGELERVEANVRGFLEARRAGGFACRVMVSLVRNKGISADEQQEFVHRWLSPTDGVILYHLAEYDRGTSRFLATHEVARAKMREAGRRWPCLNPWQEIYLLPDGRVYYCCETISKLAFEELRSMGRFPEQSIADIWRGETFRSLRHDLIVNRLDAWPACQHCGIWMAHVTEVCQSGPKRITRNVITEIIERVREES